jgi:hypothetical protein
MTERIVPTTATSTPIALSQVNEKRTDLIETWTSSWEGVVADRFFSGAFGNPASLEVCGASFEALE